MAGRPGRKGGSAIYVWAAVLGLALGTAVAVYVFWSKFQAQHVAETVADPDVPKPSAEECAIAQTVLTAIHAAGDDKRWQAAAGAKTITLRAPSRVVNPTDVQALTDDEADDVRGKLKTDWRSCAGLGPFVRGLGWAPLSDDIDDPQLSLSRPALDKAHAEAKVVETFTAPPANGDPEAPRQTLGPWLATLAKQPGGAWKVTDTAPIAKPVH